MILNFGCHRWRWPLAVIDKYLQFLANIDKFIAEVKQVDHLNLFINSLNNEERGRELEFMFPAKPEETIAKQIAEANKKYQVQ